jgi:hypothetical protein
VKFVPAAIWICSMLQAGELSTQVAALNRERDRSKLEAAAVAIAKSGNAEAMLRLTESLGQRSFLRRLDPAGETNRLQNIFRVLAEHPSEGSERLCVALANNGEFASLPVRMNFLLNALAALRPMSAAGGEVFRKTSRSGFLEVNGPLLAANGSPRAIALLEKLLADESLDRAQRASVSHWSVMPHRTKVDIVAMCARLLEPARVSTEVSVAIIESVFDYRPREWFGLRNSPPRPPPWSSASRTAKESVRHLGGRLLARSGLPDSLREPIRRTLSELR